MGNRVLKLAHKESGTWRSIRTVRTLSAVVPGPPTVTPAFAGVQGGAVGGAFPLPIVYPQIRRDWTCLGDQGNRVLNLTHKESGTWRSIRTDRVLSVVILSPPTVTPAKAGVQGGAVGGAFPLAIAS